MVDIVERLRTEAPCYVLIGYAAIEIERLREALKEIADFDTYEDISNEECMRDIARSALQQKETE